MKLRPLPLGRAVWNLGPAGALRLAARWYGKEPGGPAGSTFLLTSLQARHPLLCRAQTSDIRVFRQIFVDGELACLDHLSDAAFIVDCGANVGYASAYLLSRFPRAELLAIEPEPGNFDLLRRNLAPYGRSARLLHAAVWSHPAQLALSEAVYRDGAEWARQVRECRPGEPPGFPAVDLGGILRESGRERISILKIDIEGAEGVVFAENYEPWIDRVDNLVIELHDDSSFGDCTAVFARAIAGRGFARARHGELTVLTRRAG